MGFFGGSFNTMAFISLKCSFVSIKSFFLGGYSAMRQLMLDKVLAFIIVSNMFLKLGYSMSHSNATFSFEKIQREKE